MKKILLFALFLISTFYFLPSIFQAFAANPNFSTSASVTYTVNSSGITHVIFSGSLSNNTDTYYASSYKIHLGFEDMQNIVASDNGGEVTPAVNKTSDGEDITIHFNSPAIGKEKTTPFTIAFDTEEVASLNGSIWEVNIPGLSHAEDFDSFIVHIKVPSYFGQSTYTKPNVGNGTLTFTKDNLGKSGISLAFGDKQVYAFHLTYNLKNTQLFPINTEVALPPNTSYQHVELDTISPKPANVTMDTDGNWLAQYALKPSQEVKITTTGKAYLSLAPSKEELTRQQQALYTQQAAYWQVHDQHIQEIAHSLKTPEAIYSYVVKTLTYDFARVSDTQDRLGALGVLSHPTEAVCLEFTDLFIALARAAGIPARELDGYGYTLNTTQRPLSLSKEVLHAWPEYYDTSLHEWIMVDPTWENTTGGVDYFHTFDFDHVTLVIKGVSSTYPVPAGGYKLPGQEGEKDVIVTFASNSVEPSSMATATLDSPPEFTAGFPMTPSLIVQNSRNVLFPGQIVLTSLLGTQKTFQTGPIPPFGHTSVSLPFGKSSFLTNTTGILTIHFAGKTITKSIHISVFSTPVVFGGGIFLATIFSIIVFIAARRTRGLSIP